jgi:hypothetical protein
VDCEKEARADYHRLQNIRRKRSDNDDDD